MVWSGYEIYGTDLIAQNQVNKDIPTIEDGIKQKSLRLPNEAVGLIEIPAIGLKYPIYAGTDTRTLQKGVGKYKGHNAFAGHRTTWGKPFSRIDELQPGDKIMIITPKETKVYEVLRVFITEPSDLTVLDLPGIVLTSCHPEFSSRERIVVHALPRSS